VQAADQLFPRLSPARAGHPSPEGLPRLSRSD
jgi:hypothetical protein